ncbi:MAG TPA: hypothetical protein VMF06_11940 [Candidatus Limnocylindria bacterium]|jgi:tetratricopeptide (TPR) repeat protein|nr:hypothetical protein [Candidatus Limnocylindria bacterium]
MKNFVWLATDKHGQRGVVEFQSNSAREAKEDLISKGYTDVELAEDETASTSRVVIRGKEVQAPAEYRINNRNTPPPTFTRLIWEGVSQNAWLFLWVAILLTTSAITHHPILFACTAVLAVAGLCWRLWFGLSSIYYRRLLNAMEWHRWNKANDAINTLEILGKINPIAVPKRELLRQRAQVLAAQGQLSEALAVFRPVQFDPVTPIWLYYLHLSGIHERAKDHEGAIELSRKAVAENSDGPTAHFDLVFRLAHYQRNPAAARIAAQKIEESILTEVMVAFKHRDLGIIAYWEKEYVESAKELRISLEKFERMEHIPFRTALLSIIHSYLACALGRLGNLDEATKHFQSAKKYMISTRRTEQLDECRSVLGDLAS